MHGEKNLALAGRERENLVYRTLQHYDTSSAIGIGIEHVTHSPHACTHAHTSQSKAASGMRRQWQLLRSALHSNQKGPANTVHNTGELSDLQAAKAREAKLYLPLGPEHEHSCQASRAPPHGFKKNGCTFVKSSLVPNMFTNKQKIPQITCDSLFNWHLNQRGGRFPAGQVVVNENGRTVLLVPVPVQCWVAVLKSALPSNVWNYQFILA